MTNGLFISSFRGAGSPGAPGVGSTQRGLQQAEQGRLQLARQTAGQPGLIEQDQLALEAAQRSAELGIAAQPGLVAQAAFDQSAAQDKFELDSVISGAQQVSVIPTKQGQLDFLKKRQAEIVARGGNAEHTQEGIQLLEQAIRTGDSTEFDQSITDILSLKPGAQELQLQRDELEFRKRLATGKEKTRIEGEQVKLLEADVKASKTKFDQSAKIRAEVSKVSDEFNKIQGSFDRIKASDKSAAGDLALIFNFMKMLDPGSVVREGEFATAQNAAGVPERIRNTYQKLLTGERLSPKQRASFESQSNSIFEASSKRQESRLNDFEELGKRFGLEREDIIVSEATEEEPTRRRSFNPQTGRLE